MDLKGQDFLYLGLGAGALWLILRNAKPLSSTITGVTSTINPLLEAAGKGASIVTDPSSWRSTSYLSELLKAPFSGAQSWELFKQQPGFSTGVNALFTNLGWYK